MNKEYLEQFLEQVGSDEELKAQIEDQLDSDGNISIDVLINLGIEFGYQFDYGFDPEDLWCPPDWRDEILDGNRVVENYNDGITQINISDRWKDINLRFGKDRIGISEAFE